MNINKLSSLSLLDMAEFKGKEEKYPEGYPKPVLSRLQSVV